MLVKQLYQLGKIGERAGQPVDLVDHDDVDLAATDMVQQLLEGWAVKGGGGQAAIVIPPAAQPPALVGLALDVGLAGLALGIQRVELKVEIMLGGFAGVDGAAENLPGRYHWPASARAVAGLTPK